MISYRIMLGAAFLSIASTGVIAAQNYSVEVLSGTYTDLDAPVEIATGDIPESSPLDIPLSFRAFGRTYGFDQSSNTATMQRNGFILVANYESERTWVFDAYLARLEAQDTSSSTSYSVEGDSENRILKFQWKNMKLTDNPPGDFVNVQLWLYQRSGDIEVHFGPHRITGLGAFFNEPGPSVGHLVGNYQFDTIYHTNFLIGAPSAPEVDQTRPLMGLGGIPANGTIYRFHYNPPAGLAWIESARSIAFHPNPMNDHTRIMLPPELHGRETTLTLYDMLGRVAYTEKIVDGSSIATRALAPGLYHAVIGSGEERHNAGKLIVR